MAVSLNSDINLIEKGATGYTTLVGHQGPANTCSYSRNMGSVLSGGSDGRVIEWTQGRGRLITVARGIVLLMRSATKETAMGRSSPTACVCRSDGELRWSEIVLRVGTTRCASPICFR